MTRLWPVWAVLVRDGRLALSYRLNFVLTLASAVFGVTLWYFLASAVHPAGPWAAGGYFAYLITGTAFMGFVGTALHTFGRKLREDQLMGTLEILLSSPASAFTVLAASILWELILQALLVAGTLLLAVAFGMRFMVGSWLAALLITGLTVAVFAALGLCAASLLLVFQRGEPVTPFVGGLFALLGGVFFPTSVLPGALRTLSEFVPLTYSLSGIRSVLLEGGTLRSVGPELAALSLFNALLWPLALILLRLCLRWARRFGLLGNY